MLSEEGWTKSRNWVRRIFLIAVFAGLVAAAASGVTSLVVSRLAWSDLERHYLSSYLWAASPSVFSATGTYTVVVVGAPPGRDYLATPEDVIRRNRGFELTSVARNRGAIRVGERQYADIPHADMYWKLRDNVFAGQSLWQVFRVPRFLGLIIFVALVWIGVLREHKDRQAKKVGSIEQGPRLVTPEEFNEIYRGDGIGLEVRGKQRTFELVRIQIPQAYEPQSAVLLGDTGAGKTVALKQIIDQIEERGDIAVIHDPKANYLPNYFNPKRGDIVLNPFDLRSPFWNPADEVSSLHDIETVANAFFPDMPGKDVFWTESPRKLMTVFLSKGLSSAEMVRLFENENQIDKLIVGSKYASLIDPKSPAQRSGVLSELTKLAQILQWLPSEVEAETPWSAMRWTTDPRGWLFLTSRADQSTALQTLYAIWLELLITRCLAKRFSKRLWFIIDELPLLRHIPNLQKLITLGRECNVPLIIGLQGRAQLDERYGPNGAEVILSQPVTKIFLRTSEPKAAKWISDSIGSQAIERIREGVTAGVQDWRDSVNYTPERRIDPAVLDSVIASLPNLRGYLKFLEHIVEIEYQPKDRPKRAEAMILRPVKSRQDLSQPMAQPTPVEPVVVSAHDVEEKPPKPKLRLLG
jgi:hypothetical protein